MCVAPHHCSMIGRCTVRRDLKNLGVEDIELKAKELCLVDTSPKHSDPPPSTIEYDTTEPEQPMVLNIPLEEQP